MEKRSLITFDLGGTLIRPAPSVGETYAEICLVHGVQADSARINQRFPKALKKWTDGKGLRLEPRDSRRIWHTIVKESMALEKVPDELLGKIFDDFFDAYATAHRWGLMPGALQVLGTLQKRGYRLAVLSNSDSRMRKVLAELNLDGYFEALFLSGEIGYEKPDPHLFAYVCRTCEVPPEAILHVGDSLRHDAMGAESAGWRHFLIRPGESSLTTLPAVL